MKKYISRLHYLTQDLPQRSHAEQAQMACEAGVNWIQYRCLTKPDNELIAEINEVAAICDDWGATLILTNHYHLLDRVDAQGVHIEALDADLDKVRAAIGHDKTIDASAVNTEQLLNVQQQQMADYCSYGPFAQSATKPNDYPLLGFNGYRNLEKLAIDIPVIAVGGIGLADVEPLMQTLITGIAVSGAVNASLTPASVLKAFYKKVY